jgi:hypothetical protein
MKFIIKVSLPLAAFVSNFMSLKNYALYSPVTKHWAMLKEMSHLILKYASYVVPLKL